MGSSQILFHQVVKVMHQHLAPILGEPTLRVTLRASRRKVGRRFPLLLSLLLPGEQSPPMDPPNGEPSLEEMREALAEFLDHFERVVTDLTGEILHDRLRALRREVEALTEGERE
ncbi:MAG TPA: DUF2094 domain-containing protein [Armatimonadetes bacterium]|nr:DUF2094 domain-containing protein [Armatimonadota bacterium]